MKDILPPPFAWIEIPAGKVKLESGGYLQKNTTFDVPTFAISKYPITNAQYTKFIEAGGYREKKWWTAAGWQLREQGKWTEHHFGRDTEWNSAEQPVVGVSWYEAVAFCRWLSETSGEPVMLPTEQEWRRAAQGDDGRAYPWGNEWDGTRCNNSVLPHESTRTTPVRQYEGRGDSPYGVVDMTGNIWEWCLTTWQMGSNDLDGTDDGVTYDRVLCGGCWRLSHPANFCFSYRGGLNPIRRDYIFGFRCARYRRSTDLVSIVPR